MNHYHKTLMQTSDPASRELYIHLLRHLERQLVQADLELEYENDFEYEYEVI
jgi:hypothetical protein